jgi:hypothetical protein
MTSGLVAARNDEDDAVPRKAARPELDWETARGEAVAEIEPKIRVGKKEKSLQNVEKVEFAYVVDVVFSPAAAFASKGEESLKIGGTPFGPGDGTLLSSRLSLEGAVSVWGVFRNGSNDGYARV